MIQQCKKVIIENGDSVNIDSNVVIAGTNEVRRFASFLFHTHTKHSSYELDV